MRKQFIDELPSSWVKRARVLHALGDETRQRILLLFEPGEELSIKDIADMFPFSRTNIAHHIGVLEKAGILIRHKKGRDVLLRLEKNAITDALENVLIYVRTEA
ncbi:MAG: metalloregulator ArsR/SmtB family transcription factor [Synergistaceae bacterium]|jgi:DNA-binding transcriptional ArsR family regulator|nr:metalloregulator ArsR/SmtB family transcription factor [Synergistaceae bacterium]